MLYAEELNYWKTTERREGAYKSIRKSLADMGATINLLGEGQDNIGQQAVILLFSVKEQRFRLVEPVLKTQSNVKGSQDAAITQAAVTMKHEIKARSVAARRKGAHVAFAGERLLPDGRTVADLTAEEVFDVAQLISGEVR